MSLWKSEDPATWAAVTTNPFPAEDAEQAHLMARIGANKACPAAHAARDRENYLVHKKIGETLTSAEESELADLKARYPDPPYDLNSHPLYPSFLASQEARKERRYGK